ncbi:pentatricopeptide repeat (PPR-like) superfamily protein [Actinidia rufa]|uniref:Pentatricopeptide repeat (PPR-like) superfamily protein n=1 Tax=Actinidia rufa TaxID=165716 RepID=A0A7J0G5U5_9ERIC|nr:pentatricopeptide repeat (PPR-like) superfamily protein [Actinidia rufa]
MSVYFPQPPILSFTEMATSISEVHQAHAHMLKTGLIHHPFAASRLLSSAATSTATPYAHSIFSHIQDRNPYIYNTIIRAYANSPTPENAITVYTQMMDDFVVPDKYTLTFVLKACSRIRGIEEGKQVHAHAVKSGVGSDVYAGNTLIHLYANCGYFEIAREMLDKMPHRDVISWNAILSAYADMGLVELAREVFNEMPERNVESWNFMVSGYAGVGLVEEARGVFDEMPVKDVVSWDVMIAGYAQVNRFGDILVLFEEMQNANVKPGSCTLANILSACAHLGALSQGECVHAYAEKNRIDVSGSLATAFVDMYSKCGCIEKALEVFHSTFKKDVSTWNSMIAGLSIHGFGEHALEIFSEMVRMGLEPNEVTFTSVLSACSRSGLLKEGREVFDLMIRVHGIQPSVEHYGCMVDLLGHFGLFEEAEELVRSMPVKKSPVVWESLLGACRNHGNIEMAERVERKILELNPEGSSDYVQLSNIHASIGK